MDVPPWLLLAGWGVFLHLAPKGLQLGIHAFGALQFFRFGFTLYPAGLS